MAAAVGVAAWPANALGAAVKKYDEAIGGFERRVLTRARRLADYELLGVDKPIEDLSPIDQSPRRLRDDEGLLLAPSGEDEEKGETPAAPAPHSSS